MHCFRHEEEKIMKKAVAILLAGMMVFGLAGCGSKTSEGAGSEAVSAPESSAAAESTVTESTADTQEAESTAAADTGEGRQFVVGFDAVIRMEAENMWALIWIWRLRCVSVRAGSWLSSLLTGIPRIWSWIPARLIVYGTALQ